MRLQGERFVPAGRELSLRSFANGCRSLPRIVLESLGGIGHRLSVSALAHR